MDTFNLFSSWMFNFIPWQLWAAGIVLTIGVLLFYFGPILLPIWSALPLWLKAVLMGLTGGFIVYAVGRNKGSKDERDMQKRRDASAVQNRVEVNHEVNNLDAKAADDRLSRYYRD